MLFIYKAQIDSLLHTSRGQSLTTLSFDGVKDAFESDNKQGTKSSS